MNERIKELAKQAGGNPNYKAFRGHFLPPPPDYIDPATVDLEKFAELIVRECAVYCAGHILPTKTAEENDLNYNDGVMDCAIGLKQHFGVEE